MLWFNSGVEVVFDVCRVDGKDVVSIPQRRLSFDCKMSKSVFSLHSDVIGHGSGGSEDVEKVSVSLQRLRSDGRFLPAGDKSILFLQGSNRISKITSDENLADSVHSQRFTGEQRLQGTSRHLSLKGGVMTAPPPSSRFTGAHDIQI